MPFYGVINRPIYWTFELPDFKRGNRWLHISTEYGRRHGSSLLPQL